MFTKTLGIIGVCALTIVVCSAEDSSPTPWHDQGSSTTPWSGEKNSNASWSGDSRSIVTSIRGARAQEKRSYGVYERERYLRRTYPTPEELARIMPESAQ